MKKALFIFLLLPFLVSSQTNDQGTLKLRKKSRIEAFASISGIFEGSITKETLSKKPTIEFNSSKKGAIISFEINFISSGVFHSIQSKGANISQKAILIINNRDVERIYFDKIIAQIESDTVVLGNIVLEIGKKDSPPTSSKKVAITRFLNNVNNSVSKEKPNQIRSIKGLFNGRMLNLKSCKIGYTINGNYTQKQIKNESELTSFIQLINRFRHGTQLHLKNILFTDGKHEIRGTPITLKIVNQN